MPRYHFNLMDGEKEPDKVESLLEGVEQARLQAAQLFGELLRDRPEKFWQDREMQVEVTDDQGMILFVLQITAVEAPALRGSAAP